MTDKELAAVAMAKLSGENFIEEPAKLINLHDVENPLTLGFYQVPGEDDIYFCFALCDSAPQDGVAVSSAIQNPNRAIPLPPSPPVTSIMGGSRVVPTVAVDSRIVVQSTQKTRKPTMELHWGVIDVASLFLRRPVSPPDNLKQLTHVEVIFALDRVFNQIRHKYAFEIAVERKTGVDIRTIRETPMDELEAFFQWRRDRKLGFLKRLWQWVKQ